MDAQTVIAKRIARELRDGMLVNLGIGIPTLVANFVPKEIHVFFQSENGLIGTGPVPEPGMALRWLTDAGGKPVTALPGASAFDSAMSFGLIRGGHLDLTVLGGLQVDQSGHLANWMIPGKLIPGMGGAMDLVTGAKRVIVAMQHAAKGKSKLVRQCSLPLTSERPVDLLVTELAVIAFPEGRATLIETAEASPSTRSSAQQRPSSSLPPGCVREAKSPDLRGRSVRAEASGLRRPRGFPVHSVEAGTVRQDLWRVEACALGRGSLSSAVPVALSCPGRSSLPKASVQRCSNASTPGVSACPPRKRTIFQCLQLGNQAQEYATDLWQRSLLYADVMRERGNQYQEHLAEAAPHVLSFEAEPVMFGSKLERPVNYVLARIIPPEGIEIDPRKRPFVVVDPRAGHGPGIGGFKAESEIGAALKRVIPATSSDFCRIRCRARRSRTSCGPRPRSWSG